MGGNPVLVTGKKPETRSQKLEAKKLEATHGLTPTLNPPLNPTGKHNDLAGDEAFLKDIKEQFNYLNVDIELRKMKAWLLLPKNKGRKLTRSFVVRWLSKCDAPVSVAPQSQSAYLK
jgi:hypothetical protein